MVGILRMGFTIDDVGLCLARNDTLNAILGGATTAELTDILDPLGIRYEVVLTSSTGRRDVPVGYVVRITWDNVPGLAKWAPTAARQAEAARIEHGL